MTQTDERTAPNLTKSIFIRARPQVVWNYLVDKDKLGQWYLPATQDLAVGQQYELHSSPGDEASTRQVWGQVLEMEKPFRLVTTFCVNPLDKAQTRVEWTLVEVAGGTQLSLAHFGIVDAAESMRLANILGSLDVGWDEHLTQLRALFNEPVDLTACSKN